MGDTQPTPNNGLLLDAESLTSKWGFDDGDAILHWWFARFDALPDFELHDLLHALVLEHLLPAVRAAGHDIEVIRFKTLHNPVVATMLDGREVNPFDLASLFDPPVRVALTEGQILEAARRFLPEQPGDAEESAD